jgi:hypothetical protein
MLLSFFRKEKEAVETLEDNDKLKLSQTLTDVFYIASVQSFLFYVAVAWFNFVGLLVCSVGGYFLYNRYVVLGAMLNTGKTDSNQLLASELLESRSAVNSLVVYNFNMLRKKLESFNSNVEKKKD